MRIDLEQLSIRLGYSFKNKQYLKQALTHCSVGTDNYERFEFLGDSILSFVIANELYERFKTYSEGQLSRLRALLVKGDTLAELATEIGLGKFLFLGQGELRSGGGHRASILADALEALFAAVYFDGGIEAARQVILTLYSKRLETPKVDESFKDAKTLLQEFLQSEKYPLPSYALNRIEGDEHCQIFYVTCQVQGLKSVAYGQGLNRKKAEQMAARSLLDMLKKR